MREFIKMSASSAFEVFVVDSAEVPHAEEVDIEREVLAQTASVTPVCLHSESEFLPFADRCDAVILWHHLHFTSALLSKLPKTRIIVRNGVGYDNVDVEAAASAGIAVSNVPDYGTEEVADHAIALTLALLRQIKPVSADVAAGNWEWKVGASVRRLSTLTLGLVGCGRIGSATALRAKAFGLHVTMYDPYQPAGYEKALGIKRSNSLEELLTAADVVSIHAPLTNETRHLISERELSLMKSTAYLVNTARGGVVSTAAVQDALTSNRIAGAGLDVLDDEPAHAADLALLPNCIVTPHSAFYSQESLIEMRRKSAEVVRDALTKDLYRNVVNQPASRSWPRA
jgi:lactate dehydrogenase-like 2-hydroxyacid dehydrogenase